MDASRRYFGFLWLCGTHNGFVHMLSRAFLICWFVFDNTVGFAIITHTNGQADTPDRRTSRPDQIRPDQTGPEHSVVSTFMWFRYSICAHHTIDLHHLFGSLSHTLALIYWHPVGPSWRTDANAFVCLCVKQCHCFSYVETVDKPLAFLQQNKEIGACPGNRFLVPNPRRRRRRRKKKKKQNKKRKEQSNKNQKE